MHTLLAYLVVAMLINIWGIVLATHGINNMPLLHFYTIFELIAVSLYYKYALAEKKIDKWINIVIMAYPIFCVINFTFLQSIYLFNTYTRPLEALIIIVFSFMYMSSNSHKPFYAAGRWIASGFLIYFCSSVFQFIFSNVVHNYVSKPVKLFIWNLHDTFVLIMYLIFFAATLNARDKR